MNEFRVLKGITENYAVDRLGNVKSLSRQVYDPAHDRWYTITGKILKPFVNNKGYAVVDLRIGGKTVKFLVHRLVALMFVENPNNYPVVNHKDCNTLNNCADNLEWCTTQYNVQYSYDCGSRIVSEKTLTAMRRPKLYLHKPVCQYDLAGNLLREFESIASAAKYISSIRPELNERCMTTNISTLCRGKGRSKTAYGFVWKYKEKV